MREYSLKFNSLAMYDYHMVQTKKERVYPFSFVNLKCLGVSTETDTNISQKGDLNLKDKDLFHQVQDTCREHKKRKRAKTVVF